MSYDYATERSFVFREEGQRMFLSIRDRTHRLLREAGAVKMDRIISGENGSSWSMLACVDRLVELGELRELTGPGSCAAQHRVFVSSK